MLGPISVKDERVTEALQRLEALENSVQNYISHTPAESLKTKEHIYEPNDLIAMSRRLGLLEALSTFFHGSQFPKCTTSVYCISSSYFTR